MKAVELQIPVFGTPDFKIRPNRASKRKDKVFRS